MIHLVPIYQSDSILSYALLESCKQELLQKGVVLKRTGDFNFYLKKDNIKLIGFMGKENAEVDLFFLKPTFAGPLTSVLSEVFQVDFEIVRNEESS